MPLNTYVSLSSEDDGEEGTNLKEGADLSESNPETLFIEKENVENIEKLIETELSTSERQAFELYLTGMTYTEIAKVLGKDDKSTDNALQRAKNKLKKCLFS